jgi:di/tricarboxylate transporter
MTLEIGLVLAVILFIIVFLYTETLRPTVTFMVGIVSLLVFSTLSPGQEILSPKEALHGFANEQLAVIVLLLVISGIFQRTGALEGIFRHVFKKDDHPSTFRFKMMSSVGLSSAFLNNTPIVAMLIPYVHSWSKEHDLSPSRFMIPLSYAAILGGCITLIGTSTNLVVNAMAIENGATGLGIFDFAYVGIPMMIIGVAYLAFFSRRLLPGSTEDPVDELMGPKRSYLLETHIEEGSSLIGKSVEEGGLRKLKDIYLVEIERNGRFIRPVSPDMILEEGDVLFFAGRTESISEFFKPTMGLSLPKACDIPLQEKNNIVEVVVSQNSKLVGRRVKDTEFRARYDGAILAVHRNGEQLRGRIGELVLRAGDVLMVLAGQDFFTRVENNPAFYVLTMDKEIKKPTPWKVAVLSIGLAGSIALAVMQMVPFFVSLVVLLSITLILGIASPSEIRNSIDFNLIMVIALGLALGKAMINSGAASLLADSVIAGVKDHPLALLAGIFLITNLLASFMTSKAAVAIVLPIVISAAQDLQMATDPFILVVAYGGAANFITPIGYQTNLMVYGPGGYAFKDFFRIGLPLTLIYLIGCVLILGTLYEL